MIKHEKQKMQDLVQKLRYWEYLYYINNESIVSDEKYDATLMELHALEQIHPDLIIQDSPTKCIGSLLQKNFVQISHKTPMLSLNSVTEKSQIISFDKRVKIKLNSDTILYCCELKIDGIAISLLYKQGRLICASTRGNGRVGEDVTNNVRTIRSIPAFLKNDNNHLNKFPYLLEIRGEIFISKLCFLQLNETATKQGCKPFSNSRNAASGSLRQLDANITASRPLSFYCYGISYCFEGSEYFPDSHWKRLQICKNWGFPVDSHIYITHDINDIFEYYSYINSVRSSLRFGIDGIVIKVDSCKYQSELACNSKAPNWAVAYKFPAEMRFTKILDVVFQVGKTGLIIPIAYLEPIIINSVMIKKVNVYNINELKRLGLMIGDVVCVQRSGDVIPKILEVNISERSFNNVKTIKIPHCCPVCGSILKLWRNGSLLCCVAGLKCSAQRKAWLRNFSAKRAMNIRGMGSKIVDQLVDQQLLKVPVDFFKLDKNKLLRVNRYNTVFVERLLKSIENSKTVTLARFIYALGVRNVGEITAKNLAFEYKTIDNLIIADFQSLSNLKCIGKIVAADVFYFFNNPDNLKIVKDLIDPVIGIKFSAVV